MLGPGSSSTDLTTGEEHAVVISLARGYRDQTSLVYCLKVDFQNDESSRVIGSPFRLQNKDSTFFIWSNEKLRNDKIEVGSIITYKHNENGQILFYSGNTLKKWEIQKILSLLHFRPKQSSSLYGGVVHRGIQEAFPNADITHNCVYQEASYYIFRPPSYLVAISSAYSMNGRVEIVTRSGEEVTFSNRSVAYASSSTKQVTLPVKDPLSEEDVGDVILVGFGPNLKSCGCFQAVCEGILLSLAQDDIPRLPSYEMKSLQRGKCIILNNESFHDESQDRDGARLDEKGLEDLFGELGFIVDIRRNLTQEDINKTAREVAAKDHSNYDAFVFIIMSHGGGRDSVSGVDGRPAYVTDIMSEFTSLKCPTLRNKPKLFFIQCCRGASSEFLSPAGRHCDNLVPGLHHDSTLARSTVPQEADFLLAFAAAPGYLSYRYPTGSVFIQVLVDVFRKYHKDSHLVEMLAEVCRQVVERGQTSNDKVPNVQVPACSNTLRAKLYL